MSKISILKATITGIKNEGAVWWTQASVGVALTVCAIYIFIKAFWPGILSTYKTNNTVGVNKHMMLLHCAAGTCFGLGALFFVIDISFVAETGKGWKMLPEVGIINALFCLHNLSVAVGLSKVIKMKLDNCKKAAQLGIDESEYYREHICNSNKLAIRK